MITEQLQLLFDQDKQATNLFMTCLDCMKVFKQMMINSIGHEETCFIQLFLPYLIETYNFCFMVYNLLMYYQGNVLPTISFSQYINKTVYHNNVDQITIDHRFINSYYICRSFLLDNINGININDIGELKFDEVLINFLSIEHIAEFVKCRSDNMNLMTTEIQNYFSQFVQLITKHFHCQLLFCSSGEETNQFLSYIPNLVIKSQKFELLIKADDSLFFVIEENKSDVINIKIYEDDIKFKQISIENQQSPKSFIEVTYPLYFNLKNHTIEGKKFLVLSNIIFIHIII